MRGGAVLSDTEKDLKDIVAKNISELRVRVKLTQLELGNAISYSDKAISKWERGESIPDAYVLLKLSEIFGVTVDYLLKDHEGEPPPKVSKSRTNHASVSALSIIAVWTVFAIAYITVYLAAHFSYPLFFMYATIVSLLMLIIFNSVWGRRSLNIIFVSAFVLSLILSIYLILLPIGNFWQINLLMLPALLIVICCFKLRIKRVSEIFKPKKKPDKNE